MLDQLSPGLITDPTDDCFSSDTSHLAEKGSGVSPAALLTLTLSKSVQLEEVCFSDSNRKNVVFGEIGSVSLK